MKRALVLLLALWAGSALAQHVGGSKPDPYVLSEMENDNTIVPGYRDVAAYTLKNPQTIGGSKRCLLVFFGQSNSVANYHQDTYTLANPSQEFVFNVYNGGLYALQWPILGAGGPPAAGTSSWALRLADNLIAGATCDRVIIASAAISSSFAADWMTGGQINNRIQAMANRITANFSFAASGVVFMQGESDCNAGTVQATYNTNLTSVINSIKSAFPNIPIFIPTTSYYLGTTCTAVTTPQTNAVDNSIVFSLGNSDAIGAGSRYDNIHFNSAGCSSWAGTANTNLAAHILVR
jgi:Carbohydrate esterase, sialic acid-specific acetylesterase